MTATVSESPLLNTSVFSTRLAETVAWISPQVLEGNPVETEEFRRRIAIGKAGAKLATRARLLEKRGRIQNWLLDHLSFTSDENPKDMKRRAAELMREGDFSSIYPLKDQLRTKTLASDPLNRPNADHSAIVENLADRRAQSLRELGAYPDSLMFNLAGGRLLRYEPVDNVSDGSSQHITLGHFDIDDAPPWDTWIMYIERSIIAWVPPQLIRLVERGISVNPVECIGWVEESLLARLRGGDV